MGVVLNYAGLRAVSKIAHIVPLEGIVKVRNEVSEEGIVAPLVPVKTNPVVRTFVFECPVEGVVVREGQVVKKGEVIAIHPEVKKINADIEVLKASMNARAVEGEKIDTLVDQSIQLEKELETLDRQIEVQQRIVSQVQEEFREAEEARLEKWIRDREILKARIKDIKKSIEEQKDYIRKKKETLVAEVEKQIAVLMERKRELIKLSPVDGRVAGIRQRSPNVVEIDFVIVKNSSI
jgi:multidrug efflux pump subunit AcrA (membrane-fusion protein)